jgi:hypothetical protein
MGLRFRKSVNLGGGFRVNLSKSGVGYSFGGKGYRYTKKAGGGTRTTASIPGTGLSYVHDTSGKKRNSAGGKATPKRTSTTVPAVVDNTYDTQEIKNASVVGMVSEGLEEMLASAEKSLFYYNLSIVGFWGCLILGCAYPFLLLISVASLVGFFWLKKNAAIDLEYTFEDNQAAEVEKRMAPLQKIAKSKKLWYISQTSKVKDKKHSAGADNTIKRNDCKVSNKVPFPFKTNATAVCFEVGKEKLVFLPDKLFLFQKGKIGALSYSDVTTSVHGQKYIEEEKVPKDGKIIDYTWKYVNKSGGPDKRFKDNRKIPVCLYGKMFVRSDSRLNTEIMFSNVNIE